MGFFSSLKKFFMSEKVEAVKEQPSVEHLVGIRYDKPLPPPTVTLQSILETKEKTEEDKQKTVYNKSQGELPMGERYLVVLDTTNRPEVKDRGLQGGLKNFYFVYATTKDQAREIVLRSFARSPQILQQIQYSFTVTPLSSIVPLMNEQNYFWSYIPINRGQRAPGQRATPPEQKMNPMNPEEVIPMDPREIPAPMTPVNQSDTPKVSEIPDEAKAPANPMAAMMSPTLPNGQPNPMYAMMQMMAAAMQGGQATGLAPVQAQPQVIVREGNPNTDPELAERMAAVRASAVPQHKHHDPDALDENMEAAERHAQMQVERFKSLPPEQRAAANLKKVDMNDVGVDMSRMREIMEASQLGKPKE